MDPQSSRAITRGENLSLARAVRAHADRSAHHCTVTVIVVLPLQWSQSRGCEMSPGAIEFPSSAQEPCLLDVLALFMTRTPHASCEAAATTGALFFLIRSRTKLVTGHQVVVIMKRYFGCRIWHPLAKHREVGYVSRKAWSLHSRQGREGQSQGILFI